MKLRGWRAAAWLFWPARSRHWRCRRSTGCRWPSWAWSVFVWLWETAPGPRSALLRGWAWGTGHFAVGSYWILEAFSVPPADYELLGPPIVAGLAAILGFFPGLAAGAARWAALRWPALAGRYRRLILLAIAWTVAEWLRGHVFTGYPWNPLGHVWAFAAPLLQGAALFGVYGLGAFTFLDPGGADRGVAGFARGPGRGRACGRCRRQAVMTPVGDGQPGPMVRIVQPNIPQSDKWRPDTAGAAPGQAGRDEPARRLRPPRRRHLAGDGAAVHHRAGIAGIGGHGYGRAAPRLPC